MLSSTNASKFFENSPLHTLENVNSGIVLSSLFSSFILAISAGATSKPKEIAISAINRILIKYLRIMTSLESEVQERV